MGGWIAADVDVLLVESPALAPPSPWRPVAMPAFDWQPSVLVIGRDLPRGDRSRIEKSGIVEQVPTIQAGLARQRWNKLGTVLLVIALELALLEVLFAVSALALPVISILPPILHP